MNLLSFSEISEETHCNSNADCKETRACFKQKCVDLCQLQNCGQNAACEMKNHRNECKCNVGFVMENNQCVENPSK